MTAEVAVLNREAVAIAADSAVTFSAPERDERKIYNTANKIFVLSETAPSAVMIYGPTSLGPIPWETVVKEYRRIRGTTSSPTVGDYATDFVRHLSTNVPTISHNYQQLIVAENVRGEMRSLGVSVRRVVEEVRASGSSPSESELRVVLLRVARNRLEDLHSGGFFEGFTRDLADMQINQVATPWTDFVESCLPDLTADEEVFATLHDLASASLSCYDRRRSSGVVVTGFGTGQLFPALSHYGVDGVIADRVRVRHLDSVVISEQSLAGIRAFAQDDMVATFMDGMDPGHRVEVHRFFDETLAKLIERLGNHLRDRIDGAEYTRMIQEISELRRELVDYWNTTLDNYIQEKTTNPIMSIVALLPKDELAELAEALVNLTSFKRRVTPAAETVGGPVDVAVISKGDGLVWLKRKHYFPPELNPRYFRRLGFELPGTVNTAQEV